MPAESRPAVLVFVRAPRPGAVKTRLARAIGDAAAARIYRRLAERAVNEAARLEEGRVRLHYTPASAEREIRAWLGDAHEYLPQAEGDLGRRMATAFDAAFRAGFSPVVVIGSDLPAISAERLREALRRLASEPVVIGPASDGGYWLLGLREPLPALFDGIPWSTDQVLPRTLRRLHEVGIRPALLDTLADVDRFEDLPPELRDV